MAKTKENKEFTVAIVLWYKKNQRINRTYYNQIREGIEKIGKTRNVKTKVIYNDNFIFDKSLFKDVDGIIAIGKFGSKTVRLFQNCTRYLVFIDFTPDVTRYDSVVVDFRHAVEAVLKTLIYKGYDKIGYLGGVQYIDDQTKLGERRGIVFKEYLMKRDMFNPNYMHLGKFSKDSGYRMMRKAIQSGELAEVYFCGDDSIALGAYKAIYEAGLKVPQDVSIIGFTNSPSCKYVNPPLSSVNVHTHMMGEQALLSLFEQIDGRDIPMRKVIPTYIQHRRSLK